MGSSQVSPTKRNEYGARRVPLQAGGSAFRCGKLCAVALQSELGGRAGGGGVDSHLEDNDLFPPRRDTIFVRGKNIWLVYLKVS